MKATVITPTRRPYSKPETLLEIYYWMEQFEIDFSCKPSVEEISERFQISTSVTRYYLERMAELRIGYQPKLMRHGKEISPSRSYILLPLEQADQTIQNFLACEYVTGQYKQSEKEK
jgi:hypothetical protein